MFPLIQLGPDFFIPTYFFWISFTYSLCFIYLTYRAEKLDMPRVLALDVAFAAMAGGFVGARLFSVFYEEWPYYRAHPLEIVKFWHGGFVFYGGLFGAIAAAFILLWIKKEKFWPWADLFAPILSLGYAVGRIGCFLAGCCYGKLCTLPWAITFHHSWLPQGPRHPTQLYACFWEFTVFYFITRFERQIRNRSSRAGYFFSTWLALHAIGRIIMEHFRDDDRGPAILGLSISSIISLGLIAFALIYISRVRATEG